MKPGRRDVLIASGLWIVLGSPAFAQPGVARRLRLTNANTGDTFNGFYRDADGPIPNAIADLAVLLRDHHANKIGPVHIETLDFLADVMDAARQDRAIVLSAYRTPKTNAMLRATMFGVAEKSQHLLGRAVDVAFDQRLEYAQRAALGMKRGGVGWYPHSGFIHLDSGPVRSWEIDRTGLKTMLASHSHGHRNQTAVLASSKQDGPVASRSEPGPLLTRYLEVTDRLKALRMDARRAFLSRHPR